MAVDMTEQMCKIARTMNARFVLNGRPMTIEEVFAPTGLLPAISRRADQLSSFCLGTGLGLKFEETATGVIGTKAVMDNKVSNAYRIMCMTEILCELMESSPNPKQLALDNLMYD